MAQKEADPHVPPAYPGGADAHQDRSCTEVRSRGTASAHQTHCSDRTWVRKSVLRLQEIILPRRLSFSGWRFRSVTAKRRSQLRLLANVRSRVRLSSSRKFTSSTQCIDSIPQWPRTASPNRLPLM